MCREVTNKLISMAEEESISWETIARAALRYLSETDVAKMSESEKLIDLDSEQIAFQNKIEAYRELMEEAILWRYDDVVEIDYDFEDGKGERTVSINEYIDFWRLKIKQLTLKLTNENDTNYMCWRSVA